MLKKLLLFVLLLLVVFVVVVSLQPSTYRVVRTATIAAPPEAVFARVNDFRKWDGWSPWKELDLNAVYSYEGPESGKGALTTWKGNSDIGAGRMTILESRSAELIRIQLEFTEPFASQADTEFKFTPEGEGTRVEWAMSGENNFISKAFMLFMGGMDKAVGGDFEKGLAKLKTVAEKPGAGQ